jgi:hypothetical protein
VCACVCVCGFCPFLCLLCSHPRFFLIFDRRPAYFSAVANDHTQQTTADGNLALWGLQTVA